MVIHRYYVLIIICMSYLFIGIYAWLGGVWDGGSTATIIGMIFMFLPAGCALVIESTRNGGDIKGISYSPVKWNRWWLVALILPFVIAFLTMAVSILLFDVELIWDVTTFYEHHVASMTTEHMYEFKKAMGEMPIHPFWLACMHAVLGGCTIHMFLAWGEEVGWRGFLYNELRSYGFWHSSLLIGVIWGLWHAPVILMGQNYPQHPLAGVIMMVIFCVLLSPIVQYLRIKTGSVLGASLFHGVLNASSGLAIMLIKGGSDVTVGITGVSGLCVLFIITGLLWLFEHRYSTG